MVELAGEDLEELVDDVEAFVENFDPFVDVEVVRSSAVVRLELGVVPEKFRGVENLAVEIDEVALHEELSHFSRDLTAG